MSSLTDRINLIAVREGVRPGYFVQSELSVLQQKQIDEEFPGLHSRRVSEATMIGVLFTRDILFSDDSECLARMQHLLGYPCPLPSLKARETQMTHEISLYCGDTYLFTFMADDAVLEAALIGMKVIQEGYARVASEYGEMRVVHKPVLPLSALLLVLRDMSRAPTETEWREMELLLYNDGWGHMPVSGVPDWADPFVRGALYAHLLNAYHDPSVLCYQTTPALREHINAGRAKVCVALRPVLEAIS